MEKTYYQKNKERIDKANRKSYLKHKDKRIAYQNQWQRENPEKRQASLDRFRAKTFNISYEYLIGLYEQQKSCCGICKIHETKKRIKLCIDHDHITGKIRGLLCDECNKAIGLLGDSLEIITNAKNYLEGK